LLPYVSSNLSPKSRGSKEVNIKEGYQGTVSKEYDKPRRIKVSQGF